MKNLGKILVFLILIISISISLYYSVFKAKKIAYVDNVFLFENSKIKLDTYKSLKKDEQLREVQMDSIRKEILAFEKQLLNSNKEASLFNQYNLLKDLFVQKKQTFSNELDNLSRLNDEKIWQKINQNIVEYGKIHGYTYILGANGQGSIMFADQAESITEDVLKFINNEYEGVK